ncbi:MAG: hypothetical protein ACM34G_11620, partial [Acidobacteriota bacterium]
IVAHRGIDAILGSKRERGIPFPWSTLDNATAGMHPGHGGTIASNSAMNFKMLLQGGAGSAVSNVLTRVGVGKNAASRGIPFMIQGTTSRPIIVPDVKGMLAGKLGAGQAQQNPAQGVQDMLGNILGKKKKPQ